MREYLHLDQPLWQQYLLYVNNLLHGDFGTSIVNSQPVAKEFLIRFPATVELARRRRCCSPAGRGHPARPLRRPPRRRAGRTARHDRLAAGHQHPGVRARPHAPVRLRGPARLAARRRAGSTRARTSSCATNFMLDRLAAPGPARLVRRRDQPPDPAGDRPGLDPARDHHPDHPRVGARRVQRGLRPDRPRQGPPGVARGQPPRHAQRVAAGRDGPRAPGRRAAGRRGDHRDRVRLGRRRPLRRRRDRQPRLRGHPERDPDLRHDLRGGEPASWTSMYAFLNPRIRYS